MSLQPEDLKKLSELVGGKSYVTTTITAIYWDKPYEGERRHEPDGDFRISTLSKERPAECFNLLDRMESKRDIGGIGPQVSIRLSSWESEGYIAERFVCPESDGEHRTHVSEGNTRTEAIVRLYLAVMG